MQDSVSFNTGKERFGRTGTPQRKRSLQGLFSVAHGLKSILRGEEERDHSAETKGKIKKTVFMQQSVVHQAGIVETLPGSITIFNVLPMTMLYLLLQILIKADFCKLQSSTTSDI